MTAPRADAVPFLEWGVAIRALRGEARSGDAYLVRSAGDAAVVAVVDGLGHGLEAAQAAERAVAAVAAEPGASVIGLARACHRALAGTRGAVMNLAAFARSEGTMTWLGVGNVEGVLLRADPGASPAAESILSRGGVVGLSLPMLRASVLAVAPGDLLVFATDGVGRRFAEHVAPDGAAQDLAETILAQHGRADDDALVLVARYRGPRISRP